MNKSILFVAPDYHNSFFYRDEFRKLGWKADIYLPPNYPEKLLYAKPDIQMPSFRRIKWVGKYIEFLWGPFLFLSVFLRYKYHLYNCGFDHFHFYGSKIGPLKKIAPSFRFHLWLSKLFGRVIIHHPSGVPDEEMPDIVFKLGNEEEGVRTEDPRRMMVWFDIIRRYADLNIGYGTLNSTQYRATHIKFRVIDLELWRPDIAVPIEFRLPPTDNLRILHSFMFGKDRINSFRGNIKGTKYILEAVERLVGEGYPVELVYFDNVPSNLFRYYQVQADIVVEDLCRGFWGSSVIECLALGKPVVTFVRPPWKEFFYRCFPETNPLPVVEADKNTVYEVLKGLVGDSDFRRRKGNESRKFAEENYSPAINVKAFAELLERL
jgi:hypothetical protein